MYIILYMYIYIYMTKAKNLRGLCRGPEKQKQGRLNPNTPTSFCAGTYIKELRVYPEQGVLTQFQGELPFFFKTYWLLVGHEGIRLPFINPLKG